MTRREGRQPVTLLETAAHNLGTRKIVLTTVVEFGEELVEESYHPWVSRRVTPPWQDVPCNISARHESSKRLAQGTQEE